MSVNWKGNYLVNLSRQVARCELCELCKTRKHTVFGSGNVDALLMFIGEAPGASEDYSALPFIGKAGELLTNMIESIGLVRDEVYICNIVKCRPPNNRDPKPEEIEACTKYLAAQIDFVEPKVICTLGRPASQTILGIKETMGKMRGKVYERVFRGGALMREHKFLDGTKIIIVPTYHPAYLNRSPDKKPEAYLDLNVIRRLLENA